MSHLLDESATERQTVERIEIVAFLKGEGYDLWSVDAIIRNDILIDMDLRGCKRSDFSSLKDCVYSHLVEMKRGDVELNQYFKD